ncbi:hypothetical protein [Herbidospora mongoliensis]|uniref:hypothetical protein n=1 Tax=Herbidospora mongoliensis TaxID=688067 RepID=UPI0012FA52AF|nr:hypothetical protein [Herbidospora mongoliensis]
MPDSSAVAAFHAEVVSLYPDLTEEMSDEEIDDSPWMAALYTGPGFRLAAISWSRSVMVAANLRFLANRHGLICYDPQADIVIAPAR